MPVLGASPGRAWGPGPEGCFCPAMPGEPAAWTSLPKGLTVHTEKQGRCWGRGVHAQSCCAKPREATGPEAEVLPTHRCWLGERGDQLNFGTRPPGGEGDESWWVRGPPKGGRRGPLTVPAGVRAAGEQLPEPALEPQHRSAPAAGSAGRQRRRVDTVPQGARGGARGGSGPCPAPAPPPPRPRPARLPPPDPALARCDP